MQCLGLDVPQYSYMNTTIYGDIIGVTEPVVRVFAIPISLTVYYEVPSPNDPSPNDQSLLSIFNPIALMAGYKVPVICWRWLTTSHSHRDRCIIYYLIYVNNHIQLYAISYFALLQQALPCICNKSTKSLTFNRAHCFSENRNRCIKYHFPTIKQWSLASFKGISNLI